MAASGQCSGKAKVVELHYAALTAATRATNVYCDPLTAASDLPTIQLACQALGRALGGLADSLQMSAAAKTQCTALQGMLAYPSPQLKEAFKAHLRAEAAQADGGVVGMAVEAELAARRETIVGALIQAAAAPAHVKMKDLFRRVRADFSDAWVASCGALLDKANAALEETEAGKPCEIPKPVVYKWQVALRRATRGVSCEFTRKTHLSGTSGGSQRFIKGWHIYKFQLAGASTGSRTPCTPRTPRTPRTPPQLRLTNVPPRTPRTPPQLRLTNVPHVPHVPHVPTYPTSAAPHQRTPRTPRTPPQLRLTWWQACIGGVQAVLKVKGA